MNAPHSIHCTCPQTTRAEFRKARNIDRWNDPQYRAIEAQLLKDNPECQYCGRPSTVAHHDEDWMYATKEAYYNLANMTPACHACHRHYRHGLEICPTCLKAGQHHYMMKGADECSRHRRSRPDYNRAPKLKTRHPCGNHAGSQRCRRNGRVTVCARSPIKAEGCDHFQRREAKA
jgi:hypothetical protein